MKHLFNDMKSMKESGFEGFQTIEELWKSKKGIPKSKGVYFVLYLSKNYPVFKENGTGGFFKGKNPNVPVDILQKKWVENTLVVYIGRGGQVGKKSTLKSRLSQYLRFGQGKNVGHWGGRYIYQIDNPKDLVVCWKETDEPERTEDELITSFISNYCKLPFGNLI